MKRRKYGTKIIYNYIIKALIIILLGTCFLIVLPCLILHDNTKKESKSSYDVPKFSIGSGTIVFNTKISKQPKIKVYISSQKKIKEIYVEDYVRGVICGEMPAEFDIEALKAQSVAARTYAFSHMAEFGGEKCSDGKGADVCDTVHCQVYMSKEERMKLWPKSSAQKYWDKISEAVNKTAGQVIMYSGEMIKAPYYFSTSGGKTEDSVNVFSFSIPYLKSVESPGEEASPKFTSTVKLTGSQLAKKINAAFPDAKMSSKNLKYNLVIKSKTQAGNVKEVKTGKRTISGSQFRNVLGLNSSNFDIRYNAKNIEITCRGNGHDVGMSQWGAYAMAKKGSSYKEILEHYYNGTTIENINADVWKTSD